MPRFAQGINLNKCINFNQLNSVVTFTAPASFEPGALTAFTCGCWIYVFSYPPSAATNARIFEGGPGGGSAGWLLLLNSANNVFARVGHSVLPADAKTGAGVLPIGQWSRVLMSWSDSDNFPKIYINGVQQTPTSTANKSGSRTTVVGTTQYIGNTSALNNGATCMIDEFIVVPRVLTAQELEDDYYLAKVPAGAITRYSMDETSGNLTDASGNGITGTPSNVSQNVQSYQAGSRVAMSGRSALPNPILLQDLFSGNVTDNFTVAGTSTWNTSGGTLNVSAIGGPNWGDTLVLSKVTNYTDFDIYTRVKKPSANVQVIFRSGTTFGTGYGIQLRDLGNFRLENWGSAAIQTVGVNNWVTGSWYQVRIRAQGTHIQAKVWADGTTEPDTWNIDLYDSTFATGGIGFACENTLGTFDDLNVLNLNRRFGVPF